MENLIRTQRSIDYADKTNVRLADQLGKDLFYNFPMECKHYTNRFAVVGKDYRIEIIELLVSKQPK